MTMITLYFLVNLITGSPVIDGWSLTMRDCQIAMIKRVTGEYKCKAIHVVQIPNTDTYIIPTLLHET